MTAEQALNITKENQISIGELFEVIKREASEGKSFLVLSNYLSNEQIHRLMESRFKISRLDGPMATGQEYLITWD